jgi:hypothetical protein
MDIDGNIYKGAKTYARSHNINVKDFTEKAIVAAMDQSEPTTRTSTMKPENDLSPQVRSLIGVARKSGISDIDGRDERMKYLTERQ